MGLFSRIRSAFRRPDPRIKALAERSAAKDEYRQAKVRGDTRRLHEAEQRLQAATLRVLRLETSR